MADAPPWESALVSDHTSEGWEESAKLDVDKTRSLLDQLLADSRLYKRSKDFKDLLDFVVRLRNFAPFNAMLLQVQKPGLGYAAFASDWRERFQRKPKPGARPLLILWPFGPVALVYDEVDTEGPDLPKDVRRFLARGDIDATKLKSFEPILKRKNIACCWVDAGDLHAGLLEVLQRARNEKQATQYRIHINRNHVAAAQFATLTHELGHLFLGHLGPDQKLNVPHRPAVALAQQEIEADSVSFIVCRRNGIKYESHTYLTDFVKENTVVESLDVYQIMRATGQVESLLQLTHSSPQSKPDGTSKAAAKTV